MFRRNIVCFILMVSLIGTPAISLAQLGVEPSLGIKITPETPGPNENVTIVLTSYSTDLNRALISWTVDGQLSLSGYGKNSFSLNSPNTGSQKTVTINIVTQNGIKMERVVILAPQDVDLLWEAIDSYTPPFYKGKALPSREALIEITAVPALRNSAGSKLSDTDLVYTWTHNYTAMPNYSGYGKNSYVYKNAYLDNPDTISLVVSSRDGGQNAKKDLRLSLGSPKIVFYPKDPTTSVVSDYAIDEKYRLQKDSVTVVAIPYFFSSGSGNPADSILSYVWEINNQTQTVPNIKNELTIKKPVGVSGTSSIGLNVVNGKTLYQKKESVISVEY